MKALATSLCGLFSATVERGRVEAHVKAVSLNGPVSATHARWQAASDRATVRASEAHGHLTLTIIGADGHGFEVVVPSHELHPDGTLPSVLSLSVAMVKPRESAASNAWDNLDSYGPSA